MILIYKNVELGQKKMLINKCQLFKNDKSTYGLDKTTYGLGGHSDLGEIGAEREHIFNVAL